MDFLTEVSRQAWAMLVEAAPYIWLGLIAAGLLHAWVPQDWVLRRLGGRGQGSVWMAALLGVPLPLCSCGVIPAAVGLRKQGAGRGATLSFLISEPETSVDSIAVTYALLGPIWAVIRPVAAMFVAILTGTIANLFPDPYKPPEGVANCAVCGEPGNHPHRQRARLKRTWNFVFKDLLPDIGGWLMLGVLASGLVMALLPADFFATIPGGAWTQMLTMLVIGIPLYICASASTPLAAALLLKGMAPGAALVLLLTGPATNLASAVVVSKQLGRVGSIIYFGGIAIGSLVAGAIVQWLAPTWKLGQVELETGTLPVWFGVAAAILLLAAIVIPWLGKRLQRKVRHGGAQSQTSTESRPQPLSR